MNNFINQLNEKVLKYPEASIIFSVSEDTSFHEHNSLYIPDCDTYIYVEDMAEYGDKLLCEEDLEDELCYDLGGIGDYSDFSDEEFDKMIEEKIKNEYEFMKYIIVKVGQ